MTVLVGSTSEGTGTDFASSDHTAAWGFVATASGLAKKLWINPKVDNVGESIKVGIYANDVGDVPGARLGVAGPFTIPAGTGPYAFDISSLGISIVSGTRYHLAIRDAGANYNFQGTAAAAAYYERNADFIDPFNTGAPGGFRVAIWVEDVLAALPVAAAAGAADPGTVTSGAAWDMACPATVAAGEILIAHISCRDLTTNPSPPAGWTLLGGPFATTVGRHWIYGKIADGTEDGTTISFGTQAVTVNRSGRVYSFSGNNWTGSDISNIVIGINHESGTASTVTDRQVQTAYDKCLACQFVKVDDNNTIGPFTGETGGDWTEAFAEVSNNLGTGWMAQLQVAPITSAGTIINGGSVVMSAADPWGVIGCYIRPPDEGAPPAADTDNFFAFI